jgi:hypothetical protein
VKYGVDCVGRNKKINNIMKTTFLTFSVGLNVLLLLFIVNERTNFLNFEKELSDFSENELIEMLDGKTTAGEMTAKEWTILNHITLLRNKEFGIDSDTVNHQTALYTVQENEEKERLDDMKRTYCVNSALVSKFHEMMNFNFPNAKYKQSSIKVEESGPCSIKVAVTTYEKPYNWKTFYIFKVSLNTDEEKYEMETIKSDFIG